MTCVVMYCITHYSISLIYPVWKVICYTCCYSTFELACNTAAS